MNKLIPNWSETLQQQTREALAELPVTRNGMLHFKHAELGFASADLADLTGNRLLLRVVVGPGEYSFPDVDTLLQAGWAID